MRSHLLDMGLAMRTAIPLVLTLVLSATDATADVLTLTSDVDVQNLEATVRFLNDTDPATESMSSFQLRMLLVPQAGATGSLTFQSADIPTIDYIFLNGSFGLTKEGVGTSELYVDDFSSTGGEIATSGKSLLDVAFDASGATGSFDLVARLDVGDDSAWFDAGFQQHEFAGGVAGQGTEVDVVIGTIDVDSIPEPNCIILLSIATSVGFLGWRKRLRAISGSSSSPSA